jgi:hypothetical protein
MKYTKPEIVVVSAAINAIQASFVKAPGPTDAECHPHGDERPTPCTYQADEE